MFVEGEEGPVPRLIDSRVARLASRDLRGRSHDPSMHSNYRPRELIQTLLIPLRAREMRCTRAASGAPARDRPSAYSGSGFFSPGHFPVVR
jgi:hypothetical protein